MNGLMSMVGLGGSSQPAPAAPAIAPAPVANNSAALLQSQYVMQQQQQQAQSEQFTQLLAEQQALQAAQVSNSALTAAAAPAAAVAKPVNFATIMTSPGGLLGNPLLSQSKLGG